MALVVKDRVKESSTTSGTGTLTLAGAVTGFQAFSAALSNGDTTYYAIAESSTGAWEVGLGTYTASGTTLARTTVLGSSNSGSAINLSGAGADVFITQPADKAAYFDAAGDLFLNQDPTSALQSATKQYVDSIAAAGIHYHDPVRVEREGNLTATYNNGTAGVGATLTNSGTQAALVIDGVTLNSADRVLVYEQTNATQNGIYTVTNTGSVSTNWVLTRATDADSYGPSDPDSLGQGDAFFVQEGAAGAGETYVMNTEGTITFGTTNITFAQFSSAQIYSAGNGLTLTGVTFAAGAGTGVTVNANDIAIGQDVGTSADVTFNTVAADLTGAVTGNVTGNASTASALQTARNIALTGAVTGSTSFDGSGNVSITTTATSDPTITLGGDLSGSATLTNLGNATLTATINANSVALGTDTTGNYVGSGATSGNGISGSVSSEGGTFTVTSNATNANTASTVVFRDGSGNFSAGTITAALNGNASTATNAGTLDGLDSSQFLRSDTNDSIASPFDLDFSTGNTSNYIPADNVTALSVAPFSALAWHDVFAFNRYYSASQEEWNGSSWSSTTLDSSLFAQKENQSITVASGSTITKVRWNFTGTSWIQPQWLVIGFTYVAGGASKTVTVESSSDGGSTWTTRHSSTTTASGKVVHFKLSDWSGDNDVRITIDRNDSNNLEMSYMSLLTARSGDQGKGKEAQVPFAWDASKNITLEGSLNGGTPWTTANDGSGSGLDADLLDGQQGSYYTDITSRLGYTPVEQGGGTGQGSNKLYMGWSGSALFLQVDTTNFSSTWPISVTGDAGTVDGLNASQFIRSDADDTATGVVTFSNRINAHEIRTDTNQELILNAGESASYATGQTGEYVYLNGDNGVQINTSPDNWSSGWAGRDTFTFSSSGLQFPDGSSQSSAGASTGKAIAMAIVFG